MRCLPVAAMAAWSIVTLPAQEAAPARIEDFRFSNRTFGGQPLAESAFQDNVLIVDLWGTWCPPCREAVPCLVRLYEQYKHHGLEVVGFCYARDGAAEAADVVRTFAVENRITYALLPGTADVREQVPSFQGYPTLLLFQRGRVHERTLVGFDADKGKELEQWVRKSLGLDAEPAKGDGDREAAEEVPAGRIFEPGNADRDFALEARDIDGKEFAFAELRGKPVLLALTTSWDQNAARTARFLESVRQEVAGVHVVAWHLEQGRDPTAKVAAARDFIAAQQVGYRAFVTDLAVARQKVHRFASMPTVLLFDAQGVLVHRAGGTSDAIEQRIRAEVVKLVTGQAGR